jgi:hypothetical protein
MVLNVTGNEYATVCEKKILPEQKLSIKFPFLGFSDRGLYFWNYSYLEGPKHDPGLWSFDLRTCQVIQQGNPLGDFMLHNAARDPSSIGVIPPNPSKSALSGGFALVSDRNLTAYYVSFYYYYDQNDRWSAPPPPLGKYLQAPGPWGTGEFLYTLVDEVCATWPPNPITGYCQAYTVVQTLITVDNLFSGTTISANLRTFKHTSKLQLGNVARWQTLYTGISTDAGLLMFMITPKSYTNRTASLIYLGHGSDYELYMNDIMSLSEDPTQVLDDGPTNHILASSDIYFGLKEKLKRFAFVVTSGLTDAQKQVTRFQFDNNIQY